MRNSLLELDPYADALLILRCPNLQQVRAVEEQVEDVEWNLPGEAESKEDKKSKTSTELDEITSLTPFDEDGNPQEIMFRVSAKHLRLASPFFDKMLKGGFQEAKPNNEGLLEFRAQDWNVRALLILLDIIHGHHRQVPKELDLDTIAHIALLVDYYDCLEIVDVFSDHWLTNLAEWEIYEWSEVHRNSAFHFDKAEVLMLFSAWIFRKQKEFKNLVMSAIYETSGPIETELPIPSHILDKIEEQRIGLLEELFAQLYTLQFDLFQGNTGCSYECSCRLLGFLMRQMRDKNLPMTKPEPPFIGFSVNKLILFLEDVETPHWFSGKHKLDSCQLEKRIDLDEEVIDRLAPGLSLEEFGLTPTQPDNDWV
ncbi:hypothetical protein FPOA_03674 [Fusarium poae]|uniref:BTB domain-containing protein n=1 Tax=Fusarium poae TaxID=36050 RepID=A0A1B8ARF2_FUSPO|nr:hypothetical protein FPOA_03674 [Fusarium poae]